MNARILVPMLLIGCARDPEPEAEPPIVDGPEQPLSDAPYSTLQGIWAPNLPPAATVAAIADETVRVTDVDRYAELGLGVHFDPGVDWIERTELGPGFAEGSSRKSLLWIWQAADPQLIDEESPVRFEAWDDLYRPGGHLTVHTFEAHVATARRISDVSGRPFDFAVFAGDLTDGSHRNELDWFVSAVNGGPIDPDSGADDDPVPGPGNDFNDPLQAVGLDRPWYAAIGNHETTYNGGFAVVDEALRAAATGSEVYEFPLFPNGYRDGATEWAEVRTEGPVAPDPDRLVLYRSEVLATLRGASGLPDGHGLTDDDVDAERGWFAVHPVPGKPIRLVVLDTVFTDGGTALGSQGFVSAEQLDWLRATLAEADAAHELVLVMSHHRLQDLAAVSEATEDDIAAVLAASEGVFLLITGHGHFNTDHLLPSGFDLADPTLGFFELMLASTLDFPMQSRAIEVVDEGNGFVSVYCTNLDHNSPPGSLAHLGRELAAGKWAFPGILDEPDVAGDWADSLESTNLLLRIRIPDAVSEELGRHDWSDRIESIETLAALQPP